MTLSATFYLRSSESRKFETIPSVKADAPRPMLGHIPALVGYVSYAWAKALLVPDGRQCESLDDGISDVLRYPRFFISFFRIILFGTGISQ